MNVIRHMEEEDEFPEMEITVFLDCLVHEHTKNTQGSGFTVSKLLSTGAFSI